MEQFNELIVDGVTTTASTTPQYSSPIATKNFKQITFYVLEDNINDVKVDVEARIDRTNTKSEWVSILGEQTILQNESLTIGQTVATLSGYVECKLLAESWDQVRLKYYDSVDGTHGKVYAWANRRTR